MKRCRSYADPTSSRLIYPVIVLLASGRATWSVPGSSSKVGLFAQAAQCSAGSNTAPSRVENAADARTLNSAVNCSDGGQVEVLWAGSVSVEDTISIGAGTFLSVSAEDDTAEAQSASGARIFDVSAGGLSIVGLRLSGGTQSEGGAIRSTLAELTLEDCVLEGNSAGGGGGGAIWASGGDVTVIGGQFSDNVASSRGGAIMAIDADLTVQDGARFEGNKATEGGAIYCAGSQPVPWGSTPISLCSLTGSVFTANNASADTAIDFADYDPPWYGLAGGGAVSFLQAEVEITDCTFSRNIAQLAGGALYSGNGTDAILDGCTFQNNTTPGFGGAACSASATITGGTLLENNFAGHDGGGIFGWSEEGVVSLEEMTCINNVGEDKAGCADFNGRGIIQADTYMSGNEAESGGCIYAASVSQVSVEGGEFTCRSTKNGGFLFASDGGRVNISGGLVTGCVAERRAGAVYCSGDSDDMNGSVVTISGGTFRDNEALELGGAIVAWGETTVVAITGGVFANNTARYYGGFIFLEELASLTCQGASIEDNYAGDQGGAIYGRDATWVNASCDIRGNRSPQGAAAYLTHTTQSAIFDDMNIIANRCSGGSAIFLAESPLIARGVTFDAGPKSTSDVTTRAIQIDSTSTFNGRDCLFTGWMGDTVVHSSSAQNDSLILDGCDFSGSETDMIVISSLSDAEIRNAVVGDLTIQSAEDPLNLVDRARTCSDAGTCGDGGQCIDSSLGVLCECLPDGGCLDDPATLSLNVKTPPAAKTYSPDEVFFELAVSAADDGTTGTIWELAFGAEDLSLEVVPSSGLLHPGGNISVTVSGNPTSNDVGGNLTSRFTLMTVGGQGADSTSSIELDVTSTFFLCQAFELAVPVGANTSSSADVVCQQCLSLEGDVEGVDCENPGATLASLPLREGFWRASKESQMIHSCVHSEACAGATAVTTSDDYCAAGYEGPYCAVCSEGYGQGVDKTCHSCDGTKADLLTTVGAIFSIVAVSFLVFAVVFLVGGLDAVGSLRRSLASKFSIKPSVTSTGVLSRRSSNVAAGDSIAANTRIGGNSSSASEVERTGVLEIAPAFDRTGLRGNGATERDVAGAGQRTTEVNDADDLPAMGSEPRLLETGVSGTSSERRSTSYVALLAVPPPNQGGVTDRALGSGDINLNNSNNTRRGFALSDFEDRRAQKSGCCGLRTSIKRWMARLPLDKLKILVVVWQILTVFPSIAAVEFPPSYARFLNWIDVVNLDLGQIFSASCLLPAVTHYDRLLATTLGPLLLLLVLVLTYQMVKRRAGIGSAGVVARRAAWSRHMAAGLLLTFLVFTSASTVIFRTFACDLDAVEGESFLRADYSISCSTSKHTLYEVYAAFMILVYPVGIPLLYFCILWRNRESLNPNLQAKKRREEDAAAMASSCASSRPLEDDGSIHSLQSHATGGAVPQSREEAKELAEQIQQRRRNPDLVPSMFLWKDFGPELYYYEVIECGRRILLTGVLIFIAPHTSAQAAMACIFAFASLLGFELLRPHLDDADSWLYRLGCVVIFLSNFLALLIKVDAAGEGRRDALGGLLVAVNIGLVIAVIVTSWFATQQSAEDSRDEENNTFAVVKTMVTAEKLAASDAQCAKRPREFNLESTANASGSAIGRQSTSSARSGGGSSSIKSGGSGGVGSAAPRPISTGNNTSNAFPRATPNAKASGHAPGGASMTRRVGPLVGGVRGRARPKDPERLWREDKGEV